MIDVGMTIVVILVIVGILGALSTGYPQVMRRWLWFALFEYLVCSTAQLLYSRVLVHGGDMLVYAESGVGLAKLLDDNFGFVAPELASLLLQRPSIFDQLVYGGGGGNTGSMHAICGFMIFLLRGSDIAAHVMMCGLALFGTLAIFSACRDAYPEVPASRLFVATVLFPSIPFWTSAFHKESFGIMGIGLVLSGWRAVYKARWFKVVFFFPAGLMLIYLFRAPALAPVFLGLVVFVAADRVQKTRGAEATLFGPAYFILALVALAGGMLALTRIDPTLGVNQLGENVAARQGGWAAAQGGSTFAGLDDAAPQSLRGQLFRVPLGLFNALFRPQLFDVHNVLALVSALEMTAVSWILLRAIRYRGIKGMLQRIQRSPFLMMCAVTTFVGCAFVGLVTLNFGSLARYRVPFLPFYGALLTGLVDLPARKKVPKARARLRPETRKPPDEEADRETPVPGSVAPGGA